MQSMRFKSAFNVGILMAVTASGILAGIFGAPPGYAGIAGTGPNCTACHGGTANSGPGTLKIIFPDSAGYVPGQKYKLIVTLADPTAIRWGFEVTNRGGNGRFAGTFAVPDGGTVQLLLSGNTFSYMTHLLTVPFQQLADEAEWVMDWTAPQQGTGPVQFYAAGLAADTFLSSTGPGQHTYTSSLIVAEQTGTAIAVPTGNTVLSQVVFGGGWYTAMYFTSHVGGPVAFDVNFYTDLANAMSVGGDTSKRVVVPVLGTVIVEAQSADMSTTQGWATFDLPPGVTGYGVLRQSVAGRADQEAVVPFASSTGVTSSSLTFDESAFTTGVAIWYNGIFNGTITFLAYDESGSSLGTWTITMTPGTKQAFALADSLPAVTGHRGSLVMYTSSGSIAVLGLRFGGSAFTSIPPAPVNY